jgi:hypothetical protein
MVENTSPESNGITSDGIVVYAKDKARFSRCSKYLLKIIRREKSNTI